MRPNTSARNASATTTIAVDLGATAVRVVEMEFDSGGNARMARRGVAPIPPGTWHDLSTHRDALSAAITQALSSAGIAGRSVVACLPRRLVTMRFVRLPNAPPEQMRGMVEYEAQQYVLFPLDEVILDYHVVTNPNAGVMGGDDMDTVLLAAARRSLIDDVMAVFDRAGLELLQLSVSALALAENARDSVEPTALIDVEPGELDVAVIADGQLLFTRASALDIAGVRPEVAERRVVEEVMRSFTSYQNEFRQRPLALVTIGGESGTGAAAEQLQRALTEMLEMPVTPLTVRGIPTADAESRAWATAVGMVLQSRPGSIAPISLVPNERAMRKAVQAKQTRQRLMAFAGLAGGAAVLWFGLQAYSHAQNIAKLTLVENKNLQDVTDNLKKRKVQHDKIQAIAEEVGTGLDRNHPAVDVVYALNAALPQAADIWLTQFQFERGGALTLHGETKRALAATQLVLKLQESGAFTDVRLTYVGDSQDNSPTQTTAPTPTPAPAATVAAPTTTSAAPITPTVSTLPAPGFSGVGGNGAIRPGINAQTPVVITPGNGATFTPPNRGAFTPPNGGRFTPPNGGAFPSGGFPPNGGAPGSAPGNGPVFPTNIPQNVPQDTPPVPVPIPQPGGASLPAEKSARQARLGEDTGHLILAGWQGQVDDGSGNGNGNNNGGGRRNRRNRQNGNGGNFPNNGNFNNNGNNGNNNGGNNQANVPPSNTPTYSNGSIFGAAPTNPLQNSPNGNGNPNSGFGSGPNGFGRRNRAGGFGGNGVVSPPATPQPSVPRVVRRVAAPVRPKVNSPKQTLTSFVITCRVNMKRADLIPPGATVPSAANKPTTATRTTGTTRRASGANNAVDNGSDDADIE